MARTTETGLRYFPMDVDMDSDDKIELLIAEHGFISYGVIIKIFSLTYRDHGYYYMWTSDQQLLLSRRINVNINSINEIINSALERDIFSKDVYDKFGVLTSRGIQTRYLEAVVRRKEVELCRELLLIDDKKLDIYIEKYKNISFIPIENVNGDRNKINVYINSIKDNINTQSKVNKSKVIEEDEEENPPKNINDFTIKKIAKLIEENGFGLVTSLMAEEINFIAEEFKDYELIKEAFKEAVLHKARNIKYVTKILISWKEKGVTTLEQLENIKLSEGGENEDRGNGNTRPGTTGEVEEYNQGFNYQHLIYKPTGEDLEVEQYTDLI